MNDEVTLYQYKKSKAYRIQLKGRHSGYARNLEELTTGNYSVGYVKTPILSTEIELIGTFKNLKHLKSSLRAAHPEYCI